MDMVTVPWRMVVAGLACTGLLIGLVAVLVVWLGGKDDTPGDQP